MLRSEEGITGVAVEVEAEIAIKDVEHFFIRVCDRTATDRLDRVDHQPGFEGNRPHSWKGGEMKERIRDNVVPFERPRKHSERVYRELVQLVEGPHFGWWEKLEGLREFLREVDDRTFQIVCDFLGSRLNPDSERGLDYLEQLSQMLPELGDTQIDAVLGCLDRAFGQSEVLASKLLALYSRDWNANGFPKAFELAWVVLRRIDPVRFGTDSADKGSSLTLPRPDVIAKRWSESIPSQQFREYGEYWRSANRAYRRRRDESRRRRRLLGRFSQAWGLQKRSVQRLLREAEALNERGFASASIVWSFVALEAFFRKVLVRALLQGYGLGGSAVTPIMEDFFARNGKAEKLLSVLKDHFDLGDVPKRKYGTAFDNLRKLRNGILHAGGRAIVVDRHDRGSGRGHRRSPTQRDGAEMIGLVRTFLEEIPGLIKAKSERGGGAVSPPGRERREHDSAIP